MAGLNLTAAANGQSFEIKTGETVVVRLAENPTTGYTWAVANSNDQALTLQSSEYVSSNTGLAGSGGERTFTFETAQPGQATLELKHWRAFVGDKSIVDRFSVTINVI